MGAQARPAAGSRSRSRHLGDLGGIGQVIDDTIEQPLYADEFECRTAEHRADRVGNRPLAQGGTDLILADRMIEDELFRQRVIELSGLFDQNVIMMSGFSWVL